MTRAPFLASVHIPRNREPGETYIITADRRATMTAVFCDGQFVTLLPRGATETFDPGPPVRKVSRARRFWHRLLGR